MSKKPSQNSSKTDTTDQNKDEQELFQQAMEGVKPLVHDKVAPYRGKIRPKSPLQATAAAISTGFTHAEYAPPTRPDEIIHYADSSVQPRKLKQLKQGQLQCEAILDLHGTNIDAAAHQLTEFLIHCSEQGYRCVTVIHGRGHRSENNQPVLKQQVNHWLRSDQRILAFHSAMPKDGDTGALYVLLRKSG
ncbi:MAG: Smr/MutS family endonuclease [Gammaproteobacteria bacterium]|nr:Smr/MutS family endonuclease [Gammaproteobacteria bacterium]MDH5803347.1 Smr/MutS family endonuclease [Gammaproteobacteria bacterium]